MGHKKIATTLLYAQLTDFGSDEWKRAVAKTVKEACQLIESGFDYVTELDGSNCLGNESKHSLSSFSFLNYFSLHKQLHIQGCET
jgi:hypothetical protein